MKTLQHILKHNRFVRILISCSIFISNPGFADDTCIFATTANDVPPNIVILLDNSAEMEQVEWHSAYDNSVDYTPAVGTQDEFVNGFFNQYGYTVDKFATGQYYIRPVLFTLEPDANDSNGLFSTSNTFTINSRSIALPYAPSAAVDGDGIKDNAARFRYSENYLNWLFFGPYVDVSAVDDGTDLPAKSRFYHAKKAIMTVAKLTSNKAQFGIFNFTSNAAGASKVQPLGEVVDTVAADPANNILNSNFINNVNNMGTVTYSPLAEGLASIGGYYNSSSSGVVGEYCQKNFTLVVSPGVSSEDEACAAGSLPASLSDYDGDNADIGEGNIKIDNTKDNIDNDNDGTTDEADEAVIMGIPTNQNGSTHLDDVAHYLHTHDIVGYVAGYQNVATYTVGFMGNNESNAFLINTSNNGNGHAGLYDTADPDYGKCHFNAESPDALSEELLEAVNTIISKTNTFTAPVVPVTRTTSGDMIYLAFFKPNEGNFWEGNITKFGLSSDGRILNEDGTPATYDNGAMKEDAAPYWATRDWSDSTKDNHILYSSRNIYTYLGASQALNSPFNHFTSANLTAALLGNPTHTAAEIINYIRGADVFDEDSDGVTNENRNIICGDALHGQPLVVRYNDTTTMVYFGGNDGMFHAVSDSDGSEAWAFIPPDQLHRLKDIVEGASHQYFIDSTPKAYITDVNGDGDIDAGDGVIIICGERAGGTSYFALDVSDPYAPKFLWRINRSDDSLTYGIPAPDVVIPELGETWSEPVFGRVKSDLQPDGIDVFFIGGGYSSDNSRGKSVVAIDAAGTVVKEFTGIANMNYSFASSVTVVDGDGDGFVDKVYVGDLGGQMWRFGRFTDLLENALVFPDCDENIDNWKGERIFLAGCGEADCTNGADDNANSLIDEWRQFFYPPSVTLEIGYDLVFMGSGDRENPCNTISSDKFYCVKDTHASTTFTEPDLVPAATATPDLNGTDNGWYVELAAGEKVLSGNTVFSGVVYFTTFTPNDDPCVPGGDGKLYGLKYLTGESAAYYGTIGGGIPSTPVIIIKDGKQMLLVSAGSTNPDPDSLSTGAGVITIDPPNEGKDRFYNSNTNFFYLWWQEMGI